MVLHKPLSGDYDLVEKNQNTFEDALSRVPFIVKPPKGVCVKPRVADELIELVDFSETVYDLLGIDPEYTRFGKSLLPLLSGEVDTFRDAVFCEGGRLRGEGCADERESDYKRPGMPYWPRISIQTQDTDHHGKAAMCRTTTHKYVMRLYEEDELYDLVSDKAECVNQINNPDYAEVLSSLRLRLGQWYMETGDVVPHKTDERG